MKSTKRNLLRPVSLVLAIAMLFCMLPSSAAVTGNEDTINITDKATVSTSYVSGWETLDAIMFESDPVSSAAASGDQYGNWPETGTQWVQYDFPTEQLICKSRVYWFDDNEGIDLPQSSVLQYMKDGEWIEIGYIGTLADTYNEISFEPITTSSIRLSMTSNGSYSTGVKRWQVHAFDPNSDISLNDSIKAHIELNNDVLFMQGTTAEFKIVNKANSTSDLLLVAAMYDGDEAMVGYEAVPVTVDVSGTLDQDVTVLVPEDKLGEKLTVRAFIQGGKDRLVPYSKIAETKITAVSASEYLTEASSVRLNDGIFKESLETGTKYLLSLDVDRLCASLYTFTDKQSPADPYGGWESSGENGLGGHSVGHYMSAIALAYAQTGDERFLDRMNRAVELCDAAQAYDGFLSGFSRTNLDAVFTDPENFTSGGFNSGHLNGIWAPWYSIHKIMAGLIDIYNITGNEDALFVVKGMADYAKNSTDKLNDAQMQKMLNAEHGGIAESFAHLYEITGEQKYIDLAKRFTHKSVIDPLSQGIDNLSGLHANTQIPKIVAAAVIYKNTGDEYYLNAAENFWEFVVNSRSYANGGNSDDEHFTALDKETISTTSTETCNTYNMLKLTKELFEISPDSKYIDYYENALFNHILGSQHPDSGLKTYYIDLTMGGHKTYRNSFECCVGTGMENPTRYYRMIYHKADNKLYVNMFINSTVKLAEGGMVLTQQTDFPIKDSSAITVDKADGSVREILIRVPCWTDDMSISLNGQAVKSAIQNGYISISRAWQKGDVIEITAPMKLSLYVSREDNNTVAFKYGPVLLAGKLDGDVKSIVVDSRDPDTFIERTDSDSLSFRINSLLYPGASSINLKPFYEFVSENHMVYWKLFAPDEYEEQGYAFEDRLDSATIDKVIPNSSSEQAHNVQYSGNNAVGSFVPGGGGWRDCTGQGYFSYDLSVEPTKENYLMVQMWGSDVANGGIQRRFDILVDNVIIAKDYILENNSPNNIIYQYYRLDSALLSGKSKVTVKFVSASSDTQAGGIFGVRIMNTEILP